MKQESKLNQQTTESQQTGPSQLEFAAAEELIRHDAEQVELPPAIINRLTESIAREKSWWRRWFSRENRER
jgi:hypothetical protein